MSYRQKNPRKSILDAVIEAQSQKWSAVTAKTARSDANRILEALVSDIGVDGVIEAMNRQGFDGDAYRYLVSPIFKEASSRRPPSNDR